MCVGGGGGGGFSQPEEGTNSLWVVPTQVLEVLTILEGGTKGFHQLKGGKGVTHFTLP